MLTKINRKITKTLRLFGHIFLPHMHTSFKVCSHNWSKLSLDTQKDVETCPICYFTVLRPWIDLWYYIWGCPPLGTTFLGQSGCMYSRISLDFSCFQLSQLTQPQQAQHLQCLLIIASVVLKMIQLFYQNISTCQSRK